MSNVADGLMHLHELSVWIRIGCSREERAFPQRVVVNLDLRLNTSRAARTKNLNDSMCYMTLRDRLCQYLGSQEWVLVEELAEHIADFLLRYKEAIAEVTVEVRKFVHNDLAWVGLTIQRSRTST